MKKKKILILLKKHNESGGTFPSKAGLANSASFLKKILEKELHVDCELKICFDANQIDKEIYLFRPSICIIEAIWVPPYKLKELSKLWPNVTFVIRVHSKIPFLANEGIALEWLKQYNEIENTIISFNNHDTNRDFKNIGIKATYLPNLYPINPRFDYVKYFFRSLKERVCNFFNCNKKRRKIDIGCFGAIRPLKNQLSQAFAAISYGDKNDVTVHFHINGTRVEQRGETVLKNLRELFNGTRHKLIEHKWMTHSEFLNVIDKMEVGMQVSYTESFNIVTADFVHSEKPIIVGYDTHWVSDDLKVNPNDISEMSEKIECIVKNPSRYVNKNNFLLEKYYFKSLGVWKKFISC